MAAATAVTGLYSWQVEPRWVDFVQRPLPIPHLPPSLSGHTLVQISDMHISRRYDWQYQISALQQVQALSPHFVVYTGDFVTYDTAEQTHQLRSLQPHLPLGTLGTAAILGNHDYGLGWQQTAVADTITDIVTEFGFTVLRNQAHSFAGLNIIGLDDFWSPNYAPETVLAAIEPDQPSLVLCHNPDVLDQPVWSDYVGWILAGHTHGGQVKPPFLPPPVLPVNNELYSSGEVNLGDGRFLYISRGLGNLWQIRFNARPEVTIFTLRAA
jgi:predicted MPP superfamily phosphohydrolase